MKNYIKDLKNKPEEKPLTLYDINKQIYSQMKPMNELSLKAEIINITQWFSKEPNFKYFMLLCKEKSDYTIFNFITKEFDKARRELQSLVLSRGTPIAIEYLHDMDAYEIWIKDNVDNEVYMYMLFDCNSFIIEI